MAKATITIMRQVKTDKAVAASLGSGLITEALVHIPGSGNTIHANDARLRRITKMFLFPLGAQNLAHGSINTTKKMNNYASVEIFHIGTLVGAANASAKLVYGTRQNYYGLFVGD